MDWLMGTVLFGVIFLLFLYDSWRETERQRKKYNSISQKEYVTVFVCITAAVFGFMYITGVLGSGYHLQDDHEIYSIKKMLSQYGLPGAMLNSIKNDLSIRFRFTYYIVRVIEVWLFGNHFTLWHIAQSVISILALFTAYVFARKMKASIWQAYLFVIVVFVGRQSAILWRLGPQEGIGLLLLFLTLLSLENYMENGKGLPVSILLTFLLGGIKESFLLLLPLLPFLLVIMELKNHDMEISLRCCLGLIRKRWIYFAASYLIFIVDMAVILLVVGTNQIGYAGIDAAWSLKDYVWAFIEICLDDMRLYIGTTIMGIFFFLLPVSLWVIRRKKEIAREYFIHLGISIIVLCYFLFSQFVLYAKSGMTERYLVPAVAGIALFWLVDVGSLLENIDVAKSCYRAFVTVLALECLIAGGGYAREKESARRFAAQKYAVEGKDITALMEKVADYEEKNPDVLVTFFETEFSELDLSVSTYLQEEHHITNVYTICSSENGEIFFGDVWRSEPDEKEYINGDEAQIYIGYQERIAGFMKKQGLNMNDFNVYNYGQYDLFVHKDIDDVSF